MADFTFAHREEGFDEHIEKSIRGYSNLLEDVISLSRYFVEDNTSIVDIGCSTGKMTKALIDYNKIQALTTLKDGLPLSSLSNKLKSFNFNLLFVSFVGIVFFELVTLIPCP